MNKKKMQKIWRRITGLWRPSGSAAEGWRKIRIFESRNTGRGLRPARCGRWYCEHCGRYHCALVARYKFVGPRADLESQRLSNLIGSMDCCAKGLWDIAENIASEYEDLRAEEVALDLMREQVDYVERAGRDITDKRRRAIQRAAVGGTRKPIHA